MLKLPSENLPNARSWRFGTLGLVMLAFVVAQMSTRIALAQPWQDQRQELHLTFEAMPKWSTGFESDGQAMQTLGSQHLRLTAGLRGGFEPSPVRSAKWPELRPGWSSLPHEEEAYPNADSMRAFGIDPFSIKNGALLLQAARLQRSVASTLPADMSRRFVSGAFNTYPFCQTYGYFEIEARVPSGAGLWPAFWLLPADGSWPPEIDAPEVLGDDARTAYFSLHSSDSAWLALEHDSYAGSAVTDRRTAAASLAEAFHRYGVDWEADTITFYLDRVVVARRPTPSDMHKPFYLIVNLAVGGRGSWPGPPDNQTAFPAQLAIRAINVWKSDEGMSSRRIPAANVPSATK